MLLLCLQVQAQMEAMAKQMQQPEMQEQLQEAQALMQTPEFAQRVEMLKVMCMYAAMSPCKTQFHHSGLLGRNVLGTHLGTRHSEYRWATL